MARVGFCPKLWKKIWAIGWGLSTSEARSLPMQNARETLIAVKSIRVLIGTTGSMMNWPQPKIPATPIALTIAQGTATAALEASSLIWTLESKEPKNDVD